MSDDTLNRHGVPVGAPRRRTPTPARHEPEQVENVVYAARTFRVWYVRSRRDGYIDVPAGARLILNGYERGLPIISGHGLDHAAVEPEDIRRAP